MKVALWLFLLSPLTLAQYRYQLVASYSDSVFSNSTSGKGPGYMTLTFEKYSWTIYRNVDTGAKEFLLQASKCTEVAFQAEIVYKNLNGPGELEFPPNQLTCVPLSYANAITLSEIQAALSFFYNLAPGKVPHIIEYFTYSSTHSAFSAQYRPESQLGGDLMTLPPNTHVDPQLISLNELSTNLVVSLDLTTGATTSQTAFPNSALGPFGIRRNPAGQPNEVWVGNGGTQVSVVSLSAQNVSATIPTPPSLPVSATPVGIVFLNDGSAAFEAFSYASADASGNMGALVFFDTVQRVSSFLLPLKYPPSAMVMAPDALTIYLLSGVQGMITYYDVLSNTADLSLSTFTPGMAGGYPGPVSQVFVHPDGTKLFWNVGYDLNVFDLNAHQVTGVYNSGLPSISQAVMQMTQDGSNIWFTNSSGEVVVMDPRSGNILGTIQNSPGPQLIFASPSN
jgi:hypothetical protein